jgi:hypothetical protein
MAIVDESSGPEPRAKRIDDGQIGLAVAAQQHQVVADVQEAAHHDHAVGLQPHSGSCSQDCQRPSGAHTSIIRTPVKKANLASPPTFLATMFQEA